MMKCYLVVVFTSIPLMASDVEHHLEQWIWSWRYIKSAWRVQHIKMHILVPYSISTESFYKGWYMDTCIFWEIKAYYCSPFTRLEFSGIRYNYNVVQPPLFVISKTFSSSKMERETLYLLKIIMHSLLSQPVEPPFYLPPLWIWLL